jgi:hypothetical protein
MLKHVTNFANMGIEKCTYYIKVPSMLGRSITCMAHPQVADRGDRLQLRRVAANIFNTQPRTANKGWSPSLGGWEWS